jgi:hypothetical protein
MAQRARSRGCRFSVLRQGPELKERVRGTFSRGRAWQGWWQGSCSPKLMKSPSGTPKFSGSQQRWGRPFGHMSSFHLAVAMVLVLAALAMLITVLYLLR